MTLGERCDEIVRLIDETLASFGTESASGSGPETTDVTTTTATRLTSRTTASVASTRRMARPL